MAFGITFPFALIIFLTHRRLTFDVNAGGGLRVQPQEISVYCSTLRPSENVELDIIPSFVMKCCSVLHFVSAYLRRVFLILKVSSDFPCFQKRHNSSIGNYAAIATLYNLCQVFQLITFLTFMKLYIRLDSLSIWGSQEQTV